ncbi:MAG: hypothetical protein WDW38_007282 [Sanguina aurantia]
MQQQQHHMELQRRHELLKAEHERAMDLVALEKAAAAANAATAEEWGRRAEEEGRSLALKEAEIRRRIDLAEDALSQREYEVTQREESAEAAEQLAARYSLKEQSLWAAEQGLKERENALHRGELVLVQVRKEADALRNAAKEAAKQVSEQRQVWEQDLGAEQAQAAELRLKTEERNAAMNAECQGTTAALAEREQRLRELETQFHAERGMLQLQDQEASARALQDLQHLDGCVFEANRRLRVAEEYAQGAEGEAEGVEGVLGRLRDQVEHTESQLQLVSAALARTQDEGRASELSLQKTAQDAGAALQQMRAEAQDLRAEMAELVDLDILQQQGLASRVAAERMRADMETLVCAQEAKALEVEAKLDAEEERLGRGAARLDADEARLHTLSQDLHSREREMDVLAARMSRDADEARATAAAVAAERTLVASDRLAVAVERVALEKKEAEVSVREEEARVFKGALKADADRQLQERDRALAEAQARVDKRSSEVESARGASELEMQRRELKAEMLERETLAASKALQLRHEAQAAIEAKHSRDMFERDGALRILETGLRAQQAELQTRSREVADAKERVTAERQATSTERTDLERSWADARRVQREADNAREAAAALTERAEGRERRAREGEERAVVLEKEAAARVAEGIAAVAVARERELAAAERERVATRCSEASGTWLASKASEEGRLQRLGEEAVATTAAAAAALEEAGKEQRVADGLRKVLAGIESGLESREGRLLEQWAALHSQAAAFRRGAAPRETLLEDWKEQLPHYATSSAASRRPLPATSLLAESSRGAEHAAVAVERRRAALMERESELQQWSMSLQLGAAQLAVYEASLRATQGRSTSHDARQSALDLSALELAGLKAQLSRREADGGEQRRQAELRARQAEGDAAALLCRTQAEAGAVLQQVRCLPPFPRRNLRWGEGTGGQQRSGAVTDPTCCAVLGWLAEEAAASKARRLDERLAQLESTALATSEAATLRLRQIEQSSEASATAAAAAAAAITNRAEGEAAATCAAAAAARKAAEEAGARVERDAAAAAAAGADVDVRVALVGEMEGRLRLLQQQLEARRGQVEVQERALQSLQSLLEEVHGERAALAAARADLERRSAELADAKVALSEGQAGLRAETAKLSAGFLDLSTGVSQLEGLLERQAELESREAELNDQEAHLTEFHAQLQRDAAQLQSLRAQLQADASELRERDAAQLRSLRAQLQADASQLGEREAQLGAAQEDLEKFKHGRAALIDEIQGQQEGLAAQERSLAVRREAVHTSEASLAAEVEGVARRGAEVEALRARVVLEGQAAEGLRQRCSAQLAELDRRQVALDQEEDDARGSRMRGAASASEQANALHQEQEAVAAQRSELAQQRQQWASQQQDLSALQQQCAAQSATLQLQQGHLASAQQRLAVAERRVEAEGAALAHAQAALRVEGGEAEAQAAGVAARMAACLRLEAAAAAAHQRVAAEMSSWESRAAGLMDTRQAQVQSFFQHTTAGLDAREAALKAMQGRAFSDLECQVTALAAAADSLRQHQQLSLQRQSLTAAATASAAQTSHQQEQQQREAAHHAHLHTQQRCAQLQEQLQEQQRECLLLQGQLSSLQDAAQLRAAEAALAAMQLREAHAAAVGAVEEGDRRVLGAENGRAQALQTLSTLQAHQQSLMASSEAAASQLRQLQTERDAQQRTSATLLAAAAAAAAAAQAERQAVFAGMLHTQEGEIQLLRSETARLTDALHLEEQRSTQQAAHLQTSQASTLTHQAALDEKNRILAEMTHRIQIQADALAAADRSAATSLRQLQAHDSEKLQLGALSAELERTRGELRRQAAEFEERGRGLVTDEGAVAEHRARMARVAAEVEAGRRELDGRLAEAMAGEGRLKQQQQELSEAQEALACAQSAVAAAAEELAVQKVSLVRMTGEKGRSLEALAQHQVALATQKAELESRELALPGIEAAAAEAGVHVQREAELLRRAREELEADRAVLQMQSALTRGAETRAATILADAHSAAERLTSKALAVMSQKQQQQQQQSQPPLQQEQYRQSQRLPTSQKQQNSSSSTEPLRRNLFQKELQLQQQQDGSSNRNSVTGTATTALAAGFESDYLPRAFNTAPLNTITNMQLPYSSDNVAARLSFSRAMLDPPSFQSSLNTNNITSNTRNTVRNRTVSSYTDDVRGLQQPEASATPIIATAGAVGEKGAGGRGQAGRRAGGEEEKLTEPWLPSAEVLETLSVSSGTTAAASDRPLIGSVLPEAQRRGEALRSSGALGLSRIQPSQRFSELLPLQPPMFGEPTSRQQAPFTEPRGDSGGGGNEGGGSSGGSSGDTMRQQRTLQVLLASLQHSCERGGERLQRLSRILDSLAGDAADPRMVSRCFAALAELRRELSEMQRGGSVFSKRAAAAVDRTEQTSVRRALESQQRLLARWEEAVAGQMEVVTSLQEPAQRSSLINSLGLAASRGDLSMSFTSRRG